MHKPNKKQAAFSFNLSKQTTLAFQPYVIKYIYLPSNKA